MNAEIRRVAFVALMLIGALVVGTTYWQAWAAGDLAARQDNAIKSVAQFKIKRGLIRAADGTVLAANRQKKVDGQTFYFRRYPQGRSGLEHRRLLDPGALAGRARAVAERLSHRLERQPAHGARHEARRAGGQDDRRQLRSC